MNKKDKVNFAILAAMVMSENRSSIPYPERIERPKTKTKQKAGVKTWYFDENGNILPNEEGSVFSCSARNQDNAERKFLNFRKEHHFTRKCYFM